MTKGDFTEQSGKVERSGIKEYFAAVEIVAEKPSQPIRRSSPSISLSRSHVDGRQQSRSDINPALAAASMPSLCRTILPGPWSMRR